MHHLNRSFKIKRDTRTANSMCDEFDAENKAKKEKR